MALRSVSLISSAAAYNRAKAFFMSKTILITGSTDGIGLEAAKALAAQGHNILLHGRSADKISDIMNNHKALASAPSYQADLSSIEAVENLAKSISQDHDKIDVLINNAGIFHTQDPVTKDGLDIRFVVNTFAPYRLTEILLPLIPKDGRIINLSSAAQAPINLDAMLGRKTLSAGAAYAQSKLAITMWSRRLAATLKDGPLVIALNPGSFLGTKMVKEGYGMDGKDISIGSDIISRMAVGPEAIGRTGQYFDNDSGQFAPPHTDALDEVKIDQVVGAIAAITASLAKKD